MEAHWECMSWCGPTYMHVYAFLDLLPFSHSSREETEQRPVDGGNWEVDRKMSPTKTPGCTWRNAIARSPPLIAKAVIVKNGNKFISGHVPSLFCTQWEPNKYFIRGSLHQGSQQLFPALTLRDLWGRSGMVPLGSPIFLPDPEVTPGPAVPEEAGPRLLHTSCFGEVGSSLTDALWLFPIAHVNTIEQPQCAEHRRGSASWAAV